MTPDEMVMDVLDVAKERIRALVIAAVEAEREACAEAADRWHNGGSRFITAADAIRARTHLK
jgi:hypothetical protein